MTTRVLVAEDSLTVRRYLVSVLAADAELEVVGEAANGREAIELCGKLRPDVVTCDMAMPGTNGLEAVEQIMAHFPTPILIVSSSMNRGDLFRTYDALAAGAVDVIEKPSGEEASGAWESRFLSRLKMVARIKVITHPRARLPSIARVPAKQDWPHPVAPFSPARCRLVAMGASTGGPGAIQRILKSLPESFPVPILLVIHISAPFAAAFAEWLSAQTAMPVAYARDGEPIPIDARLVLAPPDYHLVVSSGRMRLTTGPERNFCRPSIDVLFESAAELGGGCAAVLLTGMGRDGAEGMLAVRRAGGHTIAQDAETCAVFGMPAEAIALGAAARVLPIDGIAAELAACAGGQP